MKTYARRRSPATLALGAIVLAAFAMLTFPLPASAHDSLVSSSPQAEETVETLPTELTLTFSAKLIDGEGATETVVTAPDGTVVTDGPASVNGAIVTQALVDAAPAGDYHVIWKVVSSDGHPTSGEFSFTVTTGTIDDAAPIATASPSAQPVDSDASSEASPSTDASASDDDQGTGAGGWIWALSIGGILVITALVLWSFVRARRGGAGSGSASLSDR